MFFFLFPSSVASVVLRGVQSSDERWICMQQTALAVGNSAKLSEKRKKNPKLGGALKFQKKVVQSGGCVALRQTRNYAKIAKIRQRRERPYMFNAWQTVHQNRSKQTVHFYLCHGCHFFKCSATCGQWGSAQTVRRTYIVRQFGFEKRSVQWEKYILISKPTSCYGLPSAECNHSFCVQKVPFAWSGPQLRLRSLWEKRSLWL